MMGAMLEVTTWTLYLKITMTGAMLVVTTWALNIKITTQHLQHVGRHAGSYHADIILEDYYALYTTRWAQCW